MTKRKRLPKMPPELAGYHTQWQPAHAGASALTEEAGMRVYCITGHRASDGSSFSFTTRAESPEHAAYCDALDDEDLIVEAIKEIEQWK